MTTDFTIYAAQPVTNTRVVIQWERNTGSSYALFCKGYFNNVSHSSFVQFIVTDNNDFVIDGCRANEILQVYVKETESSGKEIFSNSLRIKTAPAKPELTLVEVFYNSVKINIVASGANRILLYNEANALIRSIDDISPEDQNGFVLEIPNLSMATQYSYFLSASSSDNVIENLSEPSDLLSFSTPLMPQVVNNLNFDLITAESCTVSWEPQDGALGYKVILEQDTVVETQETFAILENLFPNNEYEICIASVGTAGDVVSDVYKFSTKIAALSELNVVETGANFISVESDPVDGATSYNFYKNLDFAGSSNLPKFTFSGLSAGQTYKLAAVATKAGLETNAVFVTAATYVTPPVDIWVKSVTASSISLEWAGISGTSGYKVYIFEGINEYSFETTATSATYKNIAPVTEYLFQITAMKDSIESERSGVITVITLPPILATPALLRVESKTSNSITLAWNNVYNYERPMHYNVYLNTGLYATTTDTTLKITGLMANVTHMFSVTANNVSGESEPTPNLYIKTLAELTAPKNVVATALSETSISITWDNVIGATEYVVIINGTEYSSLTNSYLKSDAIKDTDYLIQVYAKNASGQSELSFAVSMRTPTGNPDAPKNLMATPYSYSFELSWDSVPDAYAYHVFIDGAEFKTESNNVLIIEKQPDTNYVAEVYAIALYGTSLPSSIVTKTKLGTPSNLRVLMSRENELEVAWDKVEQADYYRLVQIKTIASLEDDLNGLSVTETPIPITGINTSYIRNLTSDTLYEYAIYAIDANGVISDRSDILQAYTSADVSSAPNSIRTAIVQDTTFQVIWSGVGDALAYNVYLNDELYKQVESPIDFADVIDLTPGTFYKLQVSSVGIDGESSLSNPMTVITKTSKPEDLSIGKVEDIAVLSWSAVNNVLAYKIYYKTDALSKDYLGTSLVLNKTNLIQNSPITASASVYSSYDDVGRHGIELTGFLSDTAYWFAVSAIGKDGKESALVSCKDNFTWATPVILTAQAQRPAPELIYNRANNSITLKWSA